MTISTRMTHPQPEEVGVAPTDLLMDSDTERGVTTTGTAMVVGGATSEDITMADVATRTALTMVGGATTEDTVMVGVATTEVTVMVILALVVEEELTSSDKTRVIITPPWSRILGSRW